MRIDAMGVRPVKRIISTLTIYTCILVSNVFFFFLPVLATTISCPKMDTM